MTTEPTTEIALAAPTQMARIFPDADGPGAFVAEASAHADVLKTVLVERNLIVKINQRDHVTIEGWTLLGSMVGVFARTVSTRRLTREADGADGFEAVVEAVTMAGAVVGRAEAQCDISEGQWADRDQFALRSMAQTRAASKALRMPLGFVIHLAGFSATPFEEMPSQAGNTQAVAKGVAAERKAAAPPKAEAQARARKASTKVRPRPPVAAAPAADGPPLEAEFVDVPHPAEQGESLPVVQVGVQSCPDHGEDKVKINAHGYYCATKMGEGWCAWSVSA